MTDKLDLSMCTKDSPGIPAASPVNMVSAAAKLLQDQSQPLHIRYRALFALRNVGGEEAVSAITDTLLREQCPLLGHECAFCLGQMRSPLADPTLQQVLMDQDRHPMVRHEAAEALAAIASPHAVELLRRYTNDPVLAVAHTCRLAVHSLTQPEDSRISQSFNSVDPAPAATDTDDVQRLAERLRRTSVPLDQRFSAMFALRNKRDQCATTALADALVNCGDNALLQHEVAFVLGQLQSPAGVQALAHVLSDTDADEMVRHEAAEALGAIGNEDALTILHQHRDDESDVVRGSIRVALDMAEYENSDQFWFLPDLVAGSGGQSNKIKV